MKKIGFSGTFDPITNGHMWVIDEARSLADEVTVLLSENPLKKCQFSATQRKKIIELSAAENGWDNVHVKIIKGNYTARAAKKQGIDYLIRGIRNTADFDYENLIQQTNVDVLEGAKTLFVMPPRDLGSVSSSFIKALQGPIGWHWLMKKFVPRPAYEAWIVNWLRTEWEQLWHYQTATPEMAAKADHWFAHLTGVTAYGSPDRHYHNLDHLVHGLTEIRVWAANTDADPDDADTVKKAYWFHDAVYGHAVDGVSNEEASAILWHDSGLDAQVTDAPADLIRATDHFQQASVTHPLKDILLGADLAILGQNQEIYDGYAKAIRAEHSDIADAVFNQNRRNVLMHLRDKARAGQLYGDAYFAEQYNDRAIANLGREIESLAA